MNPIPHMYTYIYTLTYHILSSTTNSNFQYSMSNAVSSELTIPQKVKAIVKLASGNASVPFSNLLADVKQHIGKPYTSDDRALVSLAAIVHGYIYHQDGGENDGIMHIFNDTINYLSFVPLLVREDTNKTVVATFGNAAVALRNITNSIKYNNSNAKGYSLNTADYVLPIIALEYHFLHNSLSSASVNSLFERYRKAIFDKVQVTSFMREQENKMAETPSREFNPIYTLLKIFNVGDEIPLPTKLVMYNIAIKNVYYGTMLYKTQYII